MIKTSVICYSLLFILIVLFSTGLLAGIGAGGAPDLVNAGNNACTDSDENHNAKYDIFHDKNLQSDCMARKKDAFTVIRAFSAVPFS